MNVSLITLKPAGPLMFRAPGEFTPAARGPRVLAKSFSLPTPSTIAGCLASAVGGIRAEVSTTSWCEGVEKALGLRDNSFLRGPYLLVNSEAYLSFGDQVVHAEDLKTLKDIDLLEKIKESNKAPLNLIKDILHTQTIVKFLRVGIGLKIGKVVDREAGLMYVAEFVDYDATFRGRDVSIAIEAHNIDLSKASGMLVRFGGEGRVASIKTINDKEKAVLWKFLNEFTEEPSRSVYLYLVSPALVRAITSKPSLLEAGYGLWPSIQEPLNNLIQKLTNNLAYVRYTIGKARLLGAGFDLMRRIRKPMYIAFEPGTIVKIEIDDDASMVVRKLYENGLSEVGGRLGYGTFIPLRTRNSST